MELRMWYVRENYKQGDVVLDWMTGSDIPADKLTKLGTRPEHVAFTKDIMGLEEKEDTRWGQAEYLVEEVYLARPEHVLDQVSAHMNRCDAESFICIEAAPGGVPQRNVTSVESTPGVLAGSSKWIQRVSSGDGNGPAEGSDLTTFYCGDSLAERDLDVGQLELEFHTSVRQRSCGTQAARRLSAAHDASTRLE